ncbi:hypothetical protein [Bradyrhizobium sp. WSM471]|uniref:hypothetical protein n=1 Tax=Bradyrhizobium sp. WSM471 TaxID=319017 RepID=UPI0012F9349A|nr:MULTISPECIES: hypothetical protein [Bradyrhizobium]UFW42848.1 hypothetical protein BcanWSM471_06605 [Bradyrhizobium canariense]
MHRKLALAAQTADSKAAAVELFDDTSFIHISNRSNFGAEFDPVCLESPRQMTTFPGGGSAALARSPPNSASSVK